MPKMLPALPQAFGNLKDVFRSANQSLQGESNALGLPKVKNSLVIMVDGLGWFNLTDHIGHLPYLKNHMPKRAKGYCAFPSTTAASIVSFATAETPSVHGFIGYRVFDRTRKESINLLTGLNETTVGAYLRVNRLADSNSQIVVISKPEYARSGFSIATFNESKFLSAKEIEKRFDLALDELNTGSGKLIYLYVPELDQTAHRFGTRSAKWIEHLELLDSQVKRLVSEALPQRGVILTADHGVIDVEHENQVFLDECPGLGGLLDVGGDPRATFIYLEDPKSLASKQIELNAWLNGRADAYTPEELVSARLYEPKVLELLDVLPDLIVLAAPKRACYHRNFAKQASLTMIGQHGGVTEAEIAIPILRLGAYSSSLLVP